LSKPYQLTLADLRRSCPLLKSIDVVGGNEALSTGRSLGGREEELVGKNAAGEIVVRVKGKVTPAKVQQFRNTYQHAVSAGIIKPPVEEEPHA
jgi:hypothetical protein